MLIDSRWVQTGSGSGLKNSDLPDPVPAENRPDPQPWSKQAVYNCFFFISLESMNKDSMTNLKKKHGLKE